jgi:hypothetical protein
VSDRGAGAGAAFEGIAEGRSSISRGLKGYHLSRVEKNYIS